MFSEAKVIEIYCLADDFCKEFALQQEKYMIEEKSPVRKYRNKPNRMNDELENIAQIEHSRHRSFNNFIANALATIAANCFFEKKPAIDLQVIS